MVLIQNKQPSLLWIFRYVVSKFYPIKTKNSFNFTNLKFFNTFTFFAGVKNGLIMREWSDLMEYVSIECDGKDYTKELKEFGVHSIMFLNIKVSNVVIPIHKKLCTTYSAKNYLAKNIYHF